MHKKTKYLGYLLKLHTTLSKATLLPKLAYHGIQIALLWRLEANFLQESTHMHIARIGFDQRILDLRWRRISIRGSIPPRAVAPLL